MSYQERQKTEAAEALKWRMSLKVGDEFAGKASRFDRTTTIFKVGKLTAKQIITTVGRRFWIASGQEVGEHYNPIRPVTQQMLDENQRVGLYQWLNRVKFDTLDLPTLLRIEAAYNPDGVKNDES